MRKAITVQFNWIFVLIAGALILVFFGSIIMKQKSLSELTTAEDTVFKLEKKLSVSLTGIGKSEEMGFQDQELRVTCTELMSGKASSTAIVDPVFAPGTVKGDRLITLTKAFYMPFHVTNFLYITSSSVRYIVVYDQTSEESEELAKEIVKDMGEQVNVELLKENEVGGIEDYGHYKTKIVFVNLTSVPISHVDTKGEVKAVWIKKDANELEFFTGKDFDSEGESVYLSRNLARYRETILAAIFAQDKESYECAFKKAFKKLGIMSKLYTERADALKEAVTSECVVFYSTELSYNLGKLRDISESVWISFSNINPANRFDEPTDYIESQNNILIMNSCPEVY